MDPRDRADAALARARSRGAFVVTPDDAVSPMDAASTLQIPRAVVAAADTNHDQPDATMVIPGGLVHNQQSNPGFQPVPPPGHQPQRGYPAQPARPEQQQAQPPQPRQNEPEEQPPPRELGGLVPTVHHPGTQRSVVSRRLDGM